MPKLQRLKPKLHGLAFMASIPDYLSAEQQKGNQKPFAQFTAFPIPSISTSLQDLPVNGQGMIPKVVCPGPRKGSVTSSCDWEKGLQEWLLLGHLVSDTAQEKRPEQLACYCPHWIWLGEAGALPLCGQWTKCQQAASQVPLCFLEEGREVHSGTNK